MQCRLLISLYQHQGPALAITPTPGTELISQPPSTINHQWQQVTQVITATADLPRIQIYWSACRQGENMKNTLEHS